MQYLVLRNTNYTIKPSVVQEYCNNFINFGTKLNGNFETIVKFAATRNTVQQDLPETRDQKSNFFKPQIDLVIKT